MGQIIVQKPNWKIEVITVLWLIAALLLHGVWSIVMSAFCLCFLIWSGWKAKKFLLPTIILSILSVLTIISGTVFVVEHAASTKFLQPLCEQMLAAPSEYRVIDRQQQDITEQFLQAASEQKDEEFLRKMILDEVSFISHTKQEENALETDKTEISFVSRIYHIGQTDGASKYYEIFTSIQSSFVRDNNTGKIVKYENGAMSLEDSYVQGGEKVYLNGISTNEKLSDDGKTISFSESFYVEFEDKSRQGFYEATVNF